MLGKASHIDLMTFDSPFISDPLEASPSLDTGLDFESTWNMPEASNYRGWCDASVAVIMDRLRKVQELRLKVTPTDSPPFSGTYMPPVVHRQIVLTRTGDLKILIASETSVQAALRLRESEEESCLWRLRCSDDDLRTRIKGVLTDS
jgi:AP-4 complex subunit epsilon-1